MTKLFTFIQSDKDNWLSIREKIGHELTDLIRASRLSSYYKDFEVEIREVKKDKSSPQVRGFHRLCGLIAPYATEATGEIWDKERVKEHVKASCGYCERYKGVQTTKSIGKATMGEMNLLIAEAEKVGIEVFGAKDCFLTPYERMELVRFYEQQQSRR
jgi:hypothetical protein